MLTIAKEFQFDAGHRLWSDHLSEEQNRQIYGKRSNLHGHACRLQITVSGIIGDDRMILHFNQLKSFVQEALIARCDHAYLNELKEFGDLPVAAEDMVSHSYKVHDEKLSTL